VTLCVGRAPRIPVGPVSLPGLTSCVVCVKCASTEAGAYQFPRESFVIGHYFWRLLYASKFLRKCCFPAVSVYMWCHGSAKLIRARTRLAARPWHEPSGMFSNDLVFRICGTIAPGRAESMDWPQGLDHCLGRPELEGHPSMCHFHRAARTRNLCDREPILPRVTNEATPRKSKFIVRFKVRTTVSTVRANPP
jgi:hypothetical protein